TSNYIINPIKTENILYRLRRSSVFNLMDYYLLYYLRVAYLPRGMVSSLMLLTYKYLCSFKYATISSTASSTLCCSVSIIISGLDCSSYGALIPVNSLISPLLAFLYRPLGSLASHSSKLHFVYTSINSPSSNISLTIFLSSSYGEINAVIVTTPASTINFPTSPMRRIFSFLSSGLNPKFLFKPCLMLSPSKRYDVIFCSNSAFSNATETVDFP